MRRFVPLLGLIFLVSSPWLQAQSGGKAPAPDFRSTVESVRIDLRAVDASGRFVGDLSAADVRIFEDGKEQPITSFSRVTIPPPDAAPPAAAPINVSTNTAGDDGRLYVLLLDDMNLNPFRLDTVRALADHFVDHYAGTTDRIALTTTSGTTDAVHEFTNDRPELHRAIAKLSHTSALGANEEIVMRSLRQVIEWLGTSAERRKGIIFISEGIPNDLTDLSGFSSKTRFGEDFRAAIAAAARANVNIYAISPVGQPGAPNPTDIPLLRSTPDEHQTDLVWRWSRESLIELGAQTGGFGFAYANDFDDAFSRVVESNSDYYIVGFTPASKANGKFHKIEVKVGRPDVRVEARRGYVSGEVTLPKRARPPKALPVALGETLQQPLPVTTIPLSVSTTVFRGAGKKAGVGVLVETEQREGGVDLLIAAVQSSGDVKDMKRVHVAGNRATARLNLSPGRYHLRVAAVDRDDRRGSVFHDFEVPDFTTSDVALSSVSVTAESVAAETAAADLAVVPTLERRFTSNTALVVSGEVYARTPAEQTIAVAASVRTPSGDTVRTTDVSTLAAGASGASRPYAVTVPLDRLAPGSYVLQLDASAGKHEAQQRIGFTVR